MLSKDDITLQEIAGDMNDGAEGNTSAFAPASEFTRKVPRKRTANTLIGCGRRNIGGKGLQSRIRRIDGFEAGAMLVRPVRFDDLAWK